MALFEFFQMVAVFIVLGLMAVNFLADLIGVVAEKVTDEIRYRAYEDAVAEGLDHEKACERMDERCPRVSADDVRANIIFALVVSAILILLFELL